MMHWCVSKFHGPRVKIVCLQKMFVVIVRVAKPPRVCGFATRNNDETSHFCLLVRLQKKLNDPIVWSLARNRSLVYNDFIIGVKSNMEFSIFRYKCSQCIHGYMDMSNTLMDASFINLESET